MSNGKIFSGNQYYFVLKISISLKKTYTIVCSEITFSKNSYHVETNQLVALEISWPVSICYDFLLKGIYELILITATVIDFRIIRVLYDLNSRNQWHLLNKGLTSWNTKKIPLNLRYKHKERRNTGGNVKESKL